MEEVKNDKQLTIELRNKIAARLNEATANLLYWGEVIKKAPKISQEMVDARQGQVINEQNIKKDKIFLRVIDLMLKNLK